MRCGGGGRGSNYVLDLVVEASVCGWSGLFGVLSLFRSVFAAFRFISEV